MILSFIKKYIPLIAFSVIFCSCSNYKKIAYFRDLQDSTKSQTIAEVGYTELKIKADDILSITIQTIDPANTTSVNSSSTEISGFLVDKDGVIELPMLGKLKVLNLTTIEVREVIRAKASLYYKEPTVQVRFTNFKITVLGEVARPAPYILPNEKITVLDAIGLAGDLTVFGKRENIMLIRENNGKKDVYRFNLNSSETFKSPAFYLHQNDIIYVESHKAKAATLNAGTGQTIGIVVSIISLFAILASRL